nr:TonB family protein [Parvularcula mediterranea]
MGRCREGVTWTWDAFEFPRNSIGYHGAVVLGYQLSSDGSTMDVEVLGSVPSNRFDKAVVRQVGRWKADVKDLPEDCRRDRVQVFRFATFR